MNIERAIAVALEAHEGQLDKGGHPYILHPLAVMNRVKTMDEKIVAVLHDTVEDSDVTFEQLTEYGFSAAIVAAVRALTRHAAESYDEFVDRAKADPIARNVKIADIQENMDLSRIGDPAPADIDRLGKYRRALERLERG
ncbi:HD domain-containing protein [Paenibacillus glycinis]|uniref:HD domain-containing protein n=1 Tax=Paenibacillus glycinis TaxID=2697035 RepID=A0ABW9XKV8_9BACL|nr:HD domain-containing protein [Paenibacillus glycinis]NBD23244.1 HD domain-containing protein [Paenibacillus glycinis]